LAKFNPLTVLILFGPGALKNNTLSIIFDFKSLYLLLLQSDCCQTCINVVEHALASLWICFFNFDIN
jgi:hypothetical protein